MTEPFNGYNEEYFSDIYFMVSFVSHILYRNMSLKTFIYRLL